MAGVALPRFWNVPNTLTMSRLVLAVVVFALIAYAQFFAALAVFGVAVGSFLICCAYARDFMDRSVHGALTVAYVWLLALTVLAWVIAYLYLRFSTRTLAPRAEEIVRGAGLEDRDR